MRFAGTILCLFTIAAVAQQPAADDPLGAAIAEQQRGDYQSAIRDYRKVLQAHPDMVEAKVNLGAALAHVGQFDEFGPSYALVQESGHSQSGARVLQER
jgi:tetratricopeptide (TPR) repeat protein